MSLEGADEGILRDIQMDGTYMEFGYFPRYCSRPGESLRMTQEIPGGSGHCWEILFFGAGIEGISESGSCGLRHGVPGSA